MGCYLRCRNCSSTLYLHEQKEDLQFPLSIKCVNCGYQNYYGYLEVTQERHNYKCPSCERFFHIRKTPPLYVLCPHCKSKVYISADNALAIIEKRTFEEKDRD